MVILTDTRQPKVFNTPIKLSETSCFGAELEGQGPIGKYLDGIVKGKPESGETYEKVESDIIKSTVTRLLEKMDIKDTQIELLLGGDLMNQCTSSAYGLSDFDIPYLGLYGACSTFVEGLIIASNFIEANSCCNAIACASSNFSTAERQYRFPLNYGTFPQKTSQHTVTGCGAAFIEKQNEKQNGVYITSALTGIVIDRGIINAANMGAAMSSAAADTIMRYLKGMGKTLNDYDMILTGDLGTIGLEMTSDMLKENGFSVPKDKLSDCGVLIYDLENQDVSCGGSGCGCSAVTFCGYIYDLLKSKSIKNALLIGTGAMMSPQALLQGLSIPAVAHLVEFTSF